ncbi:transcriptional regulator [Methanobrevibacter arboriphilus]|jgi:DNA-binding MarR family transcriptional regulator|uniref:Transcriptional regulator n=1 Tax=Methanobrevibacter arboriphilus TaxID=39441 RepID=A0ACA8R279_METAZ|nr:MarR family transcriptional regulator [Methanobrevibacter arboriphilus]BBL61367.1 transcriptional regulator [Methanobrevibacter arboriphilus]GLI11297.1 transcriptional regulator [Methanobrevibacter arboriphilus]
MTDKNQSINYESSVVWLILKVNHIIRREVQIKLSEHDLLWEQYITLSRIYRFEGLNQKKLADESLRNGAAITRTLNVLEKKDLVKREKSSKDKREFLIYLTDNGRKLYKETEKIYLDNTKKFDSIFSQEELDQLRNLLNRFILEFF